MRKREEGIEEQKWVRETKKSAAGGKKLGLDFILPGGKR